MSDLRADLAQPGTQAIATIRSVALAQLLVDTITLLLQALAGRGGVEPAGHEEEYKGGEQELP